MSEIVPTSTTLSDYDQVTTLDGRDYLLRCLFNEREGLWYLSMADVDGTLIVAGIKIVVEWDLLRRLVGPARPPGILIARDTTSPAVDFEAGEKIGALDPGLEDLGGRVTLVYISADEVAELGG